MPSPLPKPIHVGAVPSRATVARHLIYHVYPVKANEVWRANVRQLLKRWLVFTGRKVVSVAMDEKTHDLRTVQEAFDKPGVEWNPIPNDPTIREAATFAPMLWRLRESQGSIFYAHTKGVAPWGNNPQQGITYWRNAMYHYLLDNPRYIDAVLQQYPCAGTTKIVWRGESEIPPVRFGLQDRGQGASPYPSGLFWGSWMFSGTFFWVNCQRLWSNWRWPFVPYDHYGVESYLSGLFPAAEAKSVYQPWPENTYPDGSAYDPRHYKDRIEDDP